MTGGIRTPATFGARAGAWLIDAVPYVVVPYLVGRVSGSTIFSAAAFLVTGIVWSVLPEARIGATVGKLLFGIRVVDASRTAPIGLGRSAVRWLVKYVVCSVLPVGYLWFLRDPAHRTWHDHAAGSAVIAPFGTTPG